MTEVDRSRKQPRLVSPSRTNLTTEPAPLSDDSDGSSLFHPRRRSSDELLEPGADGAGSSTYHSLVPPVVPRADDDESAASSPGPWRHAQHPPDRPIIIRQRSGTYSSSSPDEIS
eukprot:4108897-Pleurochrysis_carterae.AAC.1